MVVVLEWLNRELLQWRRSQLLRLEKLDDLIPLIRIRSLVFDVRFLVSYLMPQGAGVGHVYGGRDGGVAGPHGVSRPGYCVARPKPAQHGCGEISRAMIGGYQHFGSKMTFQLIYPTEDYRTCARTRHPTDL